MQRPKIKLYILEFQVVFSVSSFVGNPVVQSCLVITINLSYSCFECIGRFLNYNGVVQRRWIHYFTVTPWTNHSSGSVFFNLYLILRVLIYASTITKPKQY